MSTALLRFSFVCCAFVKGEQKMYDIFEQLIKEKGITPYRVHKETGVAQSTLSDWKNGKGAPKTESLKKIADYLGVTVDYFFTSTKENTPTLTKKDERDIAKQMESMLGQLDGSGDDALMFDGEPLDEETKELLRASLKNQLEMTKRLAKQKYTPKKYRK